MLLETLILSIFFCLYLNLKFSQIKIITYNFNKLFRKWERRHHHVRWNIKN